MLDHGDRLGQQIKAFRGHAGGQGAHAQQHFPDEVGEALDHGGFAVVIFGGCGDDVQAQGFAQEGGDPCMSVPLNGAERDVQPRYSRRGALGAEQGVCGDDVDMVGEQALHDLGRRHLDRADIDDQRAGFAGECDLADDLFEGGDRRGDEDHIGLRDDVQGCQAHPELVGDPGDIRGGVTGQYLEMRGQMTGRKLTEGAKPDDAQGWVLSRDVRVHGVDL